MRCSLLCEDTEQESFFRPILESLFGRRSVYVEPKKKPFGATFVLRQIPNAVRRVRQKSQESVGLVVVIDGDAFGAEGRRSEIFEQLRQANMPGPTPKERIAICVPSRNIETWELWLLERSRELNEKDDFKKEWKKLNQHTKAASRKWHNTMSADDAAFEAQILPALTQARGEIQRLRSLVREP